MIGGAPNLLQNHHDIELSSCHIFTHDQKPNVLALVQAF